MFLLQNAIMFYYVHQIYERIRHISLASLTLYIANCIICLDVVNYNRTLNPPTMCIVHEAIGNA